MTAAPSERVEVRDVPARGMRVAGEREPADEPAARRLGHQHARVRGTTRRSNVAPLVADGAPAALGQQPAARLCRHSLRERDEPLCVARLRAPDAVVHAETTTPAPPRRGSPAAASVPSASRSTADTPPKKRFCRSQRASS